MKKLLTILAVALLLCLVCGAAMADKIYTSADLDLTKPNPVITIAGENYLVVDWSPKLTKYECGVVTDTTIIYEVWEGGAWVERSVVIQYLGKDHQYTDTNADGDITWEDGTKVSDSTCTEKGVYTVECNYCHAKVKFYKPKAAHHYELTEVYSSCTEPGRRVMKCTECGAEEDSTAVEIPAAHVYNTRKWLTAPACVKGGTIEGFLIEQGSYVWVCKFCGKEETGKVFYSNNVENYRKDNGLKEFDGHDWDEWVEKAATCQERAMKIRWCKRCGTNETVFTSEYAALPVYSKLVKKADGSAADCNDKAGDLMAVCKNCGGAVAGHKRTNGQKYKVEGVEKVITITVYGDFTATINFNGKTTDPINLPHVYTYKPATARMKDATTPVGEIDATCTSGAYTEYCCFYETNLVNPTHPTSKSFNAAKPALKHKMGAWEEIVAPNAGKNVEGYWTRKCQRDGCTYYEDAHGTEIPCTADAHTWVAKETKPATKDADGSIKYECSTCKATKTETVKYTPSATAKYDVKDAVYDGEAVSGKVAHVDDTKELTAAYARVTFFYADGTFAVMVVPVEDGEFYAGATTATVHVAVQIVDNAKQITPPAESAIYGSAPAKMK